MPRIRRWHPVSHDFNRDPEVQALRRTFGDWMGYVWLEMLAIADVNNGILKGERSAIGYSLASIWMSDSKRYNRGWAANRILLAFDWMKDKGWIEESRGFLKICNYREYHPTRDAKQIPRGSKRTPLLPSLPSDPSDPNHPSQSPPIRSPRGPNGFHTLWTLHPGRKGPKGKALKAYLEAKPPEDASQAMQAQITYKAECDRRGVFCEAMPHLHRWISQRRWEDELPPISEAVHPVDAQVRRLFKGENL